MFAESIKICYKILQTFLATFEDKRRENFEKGQAELERRRLALQESQRKEQEERERKEREEQERKERIRYIFLSQHSYIPLLFPEKFKIFYIEQNTAIFH